MLYSKEEIELTLKLYSVAKIHLIEIEREEQFCIEKKEKGESNIFNYYSHIVFLVDSWLELLFPDEIEILKLRVFNRQTFDNISIKLGYANHSSVVRKYEKIIYKIGDSEVR